MPELAKYSRLIFAALLAVLAAGLWWNGERLESVRVTLVEGAEEPVDSVIVGGGRAPDYRLDVRVGTKWQKGETLADRKVGEGLSFEVSERVPSRAVRELRFVEDDKLDDDELELLLVEGPTVTGTRYRFELETTWDFWVGLEWFFGTPLGMFVGVGIVIGIAVFVFTHLSLDPS